MLELGEAVDIRIDGGDAVLEGLDFSLDADLGSLEAGDAHFHVDELGTGFLLQLGRDGDHLADSSLAEIGQLVGIDDSLRLLEIDRCIVFHECNVFDNAGKGKEKNGLLGGEG